MPDSITPGSDGEPGGGTPPVASTPVEPPKPDGDGVDLQAEVAKWKGLSRKHEDQAKANAKAAKDLEELQRQGLSEQERAIEEAKAAGRTEAGVQWRSTTGRLAVVAAAAAAGVVVPTAALDLMDLSGLVDDNRQVDADKVSTLVTGFAPAVAPGPNPTPLPPADPAQQGRGRGTGGKDSPDDRFAAGVDLYRSKYPK